jgi:hypothetical protein
MYDFILTMIKAHDNYENEMNFTKSDIENFMIKYNFKNEIKESNELGWILLWNDKYITNEEFAKLMDIEYLDNNFWLVINKFDDILSDKYSTEIKVLDHDDDWWSSGDYYENNDIDSYYWHHYTEETLKEIIDYCVNNDIEIENENTDEYELMTTENTYLKPDKKGKQDIYFKFEDGNEVELSSLLDEYELEELKDVLNRAICEAQEDADRNDVYDQIVKEFEKSIGYFERRNVKTTDYKGIEKDVEKIYIRLDDLDWDDIEVFLKDDYDEYDFETAKYGNLISILKEKDYFEFRTPNYNYISGDIDYDYLNEITRDRLNW